MSILENAIKMELDGEKYYKEQAEINKDNPLSTVFLMLANDESIHAKALQNKCNNQNCDLTQNDTLSKVKNIFHEIGSIDAMKQAPRQIEVYRLALINEKESIDLYKRYLSEATDDEERKLYQYLIKEEEEHLDIIDQLITHISHSEEWVESAEFGLREEY